MTPIRRISPACILALWSPAVWLPTLPFTFVFCFCASCFLVLMLPLRLPHFNSCLFCFLFFFFFFFFFLFLFFLAFLCVCVCFVSMRAEIFLLLLFDLISAHTHRSAQSSYSLVFRLQPVYFLTFLYKDMLSAPI